MTSIYDILTSIGYDLKDFGKAYRTKPLYRDSNNNTSLVIDKETGKWHDFSTRQGGDLKQLIKISTNSISEEDINKYLNGFTPNNIPKVIKLEQQKTYPKELLIKLRRDHDYWLKRGVSRETLDLFQGGVADNGKMANRYVFPIFNSKDEIVGFSGRSLAKNPEIKWKHIGAKSNWCYPLKLNKEVLLEQKEVIVVESIGDLLSLWDAGIKNVIVAFGVDLSSSLISFFIKIDVQKIILAFNNDIGNNEVGNKAAQKAKNKLINHFDEKQIKVALPTKKDFGEMNYEEIKQWKNNI
jgi:DNA primase